MTRKHVMQMAVFLTVAAVWTASSFGAVVEGVLFQDQLKAGQTILKLRGAGLLRYMLFVKAYVGALYLPETVPSDEVLADVPKHLELEYFHAIKGKDFGPATIKSLGKNLDAAGLAALMPRVEYHNSLYVNVNPGDRYSLTYLPGKGTTLRLNGQELGTIEGADFAAAIFSIWLGAKPMSADFKNALLGNS